MLVGFKHSDTSKLTKTSTTGTNRKFTAHIDTKRIWRTRIYKNRGCAETQHKLTQNTNRISSIQNAPAKNDTIASISDRLLSESHKTDCVRITEHKPNHVITYHITRIGEGLLSNRKYAQGISGPEWGLRLGLPSLSWMIPCFPSLGIDPRDLRRRLDFAQRQRAACKKHKDSRQKFKLKNERGYKWEKWAPASTTRYRVKILRKPCKKRGGIVPAWNLTKKELNKTKRSHKNHHFDTLNVMWHT